MNSSSSSLSSSFTATSPLYLTPSPNLSNPFVVHCKHSPYDVYIGRASRGMPSGETARWGNPFVMNNQSHEERIRVTNEYYQWVWSQPSLIKQIKVELKGKRLACWCAPKLCHGNVLAAIANANDDEDLSPPPSAPSLPTPAPRPVERNQKPSALSSVSSSFATTSPVPPTPLSQSDVLLNTNTKGHQKKKKSQLQNYQSLLSASMTTTSSTSSSSSTLSNNRKPSSSSQVPSTVNNKSPPTSTPHTPAVLPPPSAAAVPPPSATVVTTVAASSSAQCSYPVIDIGININSQLKSKWKTLVRRAYEANVTPILLTGTSLENCQQNIKYCQQWNQETSTHSLFCTIGIHPHHASTFHESTKPLLRSLIEDNLFLLKQDQGNQKKSTSFNHSVVAVGECGLDFFRNLSTHDEQIKAFTYQVTLAMEYNLPLFIHDREASATIIQVFSNVTNNFTIPLPPVVIHCFTGTAEEMRVYLSHGFFIGITGVICKSQRGKALRDMLPEIPLNRLMVETDAPYMSPVKEKRHSEPVDVLLVVDEIAQVLGKRVEEVREALYQNTVEFFRLPSIPL